MKKLFWLSILALLTACGTADKTSEDDQNLLSKFNSTWNIYEKVEQNEDGTVTYRALPWGGLVGSFKVQNQPVDWSGHEGITFEFAEPTKVAVQVMISDQLRTWGKAGITSLTCSFDGQNVKNIDEVSLQASDTTVIIVKRVTLSPNDAVWEAETVWEGECNMGDWANGFVIKPEKFETAHEGDKLEFIFTTDKANAHNYWIFKTVYSGTGNTLEGNDNELNEWGCASVGKESTAHRIVLTASDVTNLREKGLFVNGYFMNVTQCNLLHKIYMMPGADEGTY